MLWLALAFQLFCAVGLTYIVWRNLTKNEISNRFRPHWRPIKRFSGGWWFSVIYNIAALIVMLGAFTYCLFKFVIFAE